MSTISAAMEAKIRRKRIKTAESKWQKRRHPKPDQEAERRRKVAAIAEKKWKVDRANSQEEGDQLSIVHFTSIEEPPAEKIQVKR